MFFVKTSDGVKIAVYDYNPQCENTIFLVHGWPLSHKIYEYQINLLTQCGYRVVAIDLRGFGRSDSPACGYSYDRMASDIHDVVRTMKLDHFILTASPWRRNRSPVYAAVQGRRRRQADSAVCSGAQLG